MFKRIAITVSAATLVMLAIALAPAVPTALATARKPLADQPCAAFEAWFLDPACSKPRAKKAARAKHHLAHDVR